MILLKVLRLTKTHGQGILMTLKTTAGANFERNVRAFHSNHKRQMQEELWE